mmetsp:Transcript_15286/g.34230  ORF Transcript_15286/g.34230 Transcript_15286/m.34230 type:complete len:341 (-) Transcript_15286:1636-2658(-)
MIMCDDKHCLFLLYSLPVFYPNILIICRDGEAIRARPKPPAASLTTKKTEKIQQSKPKAEFYWDDNGEPHAIRRKQIIKKYPEIKRLLGHDPMFKYVVSLVITIQLTAVYYVRSASWPIFFTVAYFVGGTSNHMLMLAMHELSHNLGFRKPIHNKIFSIVANLPIGIPSAIQFKRYHLEHHRYQGEHGLDRDIPTLVEAKAISSVAAKFFFVFFQIFFYALRPLFVHPKKPKTLEFLNYAACGVFNAATVYFLGWSAMLYFLLGSLLGAGLHPMAGHFIAEHYVFVEGFETYSYYGILNIFAFNVGYHNEHHDFPFIPGSRLPMVRKIAPEFYDHLPQTD